MASSSDNTKVYESDDRLVGKKDSLSVNKKVVRWDSISVWSKAAYSVDLRVSMKVY